MPLKYESANYFQPLEVSEPCDVDDAAATIATFDNAGAFAPQANSMDLPRELRDIVYEYALVPSQPIQFAPIGYEESSACWLNPWPPSLWQGHANNWFRYATDLASDPDHPNSNCKKQHLDRYSAHIQPSLVLLRASKHVRAEATPVFYGQELRFSNSQGWHLLHEWLNHIGPKNQSLLRHTTVGYPGITAFYDEALPTNRHDYHEGISCEGDVDHVDLLHTTPIPNPWQTRTYQHDGTKCSLHEIQEWVKTSDPTSILLSLPKLQSLDFVYWWPEYDAVSYDTAATHPIHNCNLSNSPDLKISFLNLISYLGCDRRLETTSELIYSTTEEDREYCDGVWYCLQPSASTLTRVENVTTLFDGAIASGWSIKDTFYDNHSTYPVSPDPNTRIKEFQICNDKDICAYKIKEGRKADLKILDRDDTENVRFCEEWFAQWQCDKWVNRRPF